MSPKKIKKQADNNTIHYPSKQKEIDYPIFCFKHITTNSKYNIGYFRNKMRDKERAYSAFFHLISDIQTHSWRELGNLNKKNRGSFETLYYHQLKFCPRELEIAKDDKVLVFRFKRDKYRMIGFKSNDLKNLIHIIGFDFDFSAYNH